MLHWFFSKKNPRFKEFSWLPEQEKRQIPASHRLRKWGNVVIKLLTAFKPTSIFKNPHFLFCFRASYVRRRNPHRAQVPHKVRRIVVAPP